MDEAATTNLHCLCYKYKDHSEVAWTVGAAEKYDHPDIPDVPAWSGSIVNGGSLVAAKNGKCADQTFYVSKVDNTEPGTVTHHVPWYVGYMPLKTEITIALPPELHDDETPYIYSHHIIPVVNEACLYNLWMCACWANQADGCLCALENPGKNDITIVKPSMGSCPEGSSKLETVTAIGGGDGAFAPDGAGGLAMKCSPNPCQACCKAGAKCGGGGGGGGSGGGGKSGGGGGSGGGGSTIG